MDVNFTIDSKVHVKSPKMFTQKDGVKNSEKYYKNTKIQKVLKCVTKTDRGHNRSQTEVEIRTDALPDIKTGENGVNLVNESKLSEKLKLQKCSSLNIICKENVNFRNKNTLNGQRMITNPNNLENQEGLLNDQTIMFLRRMRMREERQLGHTPQQDNSAFIETRAKDISFRTRKQLSFNYKQNNYHKSVEKKGIYTIKTTVLKSQYRKENYDSKVNSTVCHTKTVLKKDAQIAKGVFQKGITKDVRKSQLNMVIKEKSNLSTQETAQNKSTNQSNLSIMRQNKLILESKRSL
jgi:hypothetical protein